MDISDPIGMIKKGISDLINLRRDSHRSNLDFLARFEKCAAWTADDWTYWDFLEAPDELTRLKAQSLSYRAVKQLCDDWIAKDSASKTALMREIEKGPREGMVERVRAMVVDGEDPNGASLLKETPLALARYNGLDDVFDLLIELGAEGKKVGFTQLHHAVRYGALQEVEPLINTFDPLWSHFDARSVLCEAVFARKSDIITALLDYIAEEARLDCEEVDTCFSIAVATGDPELVHPFLKHGLKSDASLDSTLESYDVDMLKLLLKQGADVHQISDISMFTNEPLSILDADGNPAIRAYVNTLLAAGWRIDDLDEYERDQIRYVTEAYLIPQQDSSAAGFLELANRCAGNANPEERTLPYYLEMLRTGESSFAARQRMSGLPHAVWTAERFGQSTTHLPDGRWVQIGGEHEDFYDPDFVIFSDVVVHTPDEGARVFFYPASVFPPTDFHTATLINDSIWIIGRLGYMSDRQPGKTLVHRLDLNDFSMHGIETTGEMPGWISGHSATEKDGVITVSGGDVFVQSLNKNRKTFALDMSTLEWRR